MTTPPRLRRSGGPIPPVRIVHLGLGAFHRAHQAWFTERADGEHEWGIAAFTGRGPDAARILGEQDGLYTLIERGKEGDRFEVLGSIVETHDASETSALRELVSRPAVTIITLTVTEKGYRLDASGALDGEDPEVRSDVLELRRAVDDDSDVADGALRTMPGRLLWALLGRASRRVGPVAVVSCDNLSGNGAVARAALQGMAQLVAPGLAEQLDVDWIDTSVDRITPRATAADIEAVAKLTGRLDLAPVVAEPFAQWVLRGGFRIERPRWETAGAQIVDDVAPYERRKLWMLNGAHSLLAYAGLTRGCTTVAEAMADASCAAMTVGFWDLASRHLAKEPADLELDDYRSALVERFRNPRLVHGLRQIATDGSVKLRNRVVELIRSERDAGADGAAGLRVVAEWIRFLRAEVLARRQVDDVASAGIARAVSRPSAVRDLVAIVSPQLSSDHGCIEVLERMLAQPARSS